MRDGCVSCEHTGKNRSYWQWNGTGKNVLVVNPPPKFTTYSGVADMPVTGANTTITFGAYVEDVTHLGTKGKRDETSSS